MQKDLVDLDEQNHLTNPIAGLDPYPLSDNDKMPETSQLEVPTQEPVVTDTQTPVNEALTAVNETLANQPAQVPQEQEKPQEEPVLSVPAKPAPKEEETYVREETPEEQYKRMVEGWSEKNPEYNYYIQETGRVVRTNQKDYEKAKFDYLSYKMRQDYVNRIHNYHDYGADVYAVGNNAITTIVKSVANQTIDFLTGSASFVSATANGMIRGAFDILSNDNKKDDLNLLKFNLFNNNNIYKDYNPKQMSSLVSDAEIDRMKAAGASRDEINEYVKSKYPIPEKYRLSPTLFQKSEEFDKAMKMVNDDTKHKLATAQESYTFYRNLNTKIKEMIGSEINESDNPNVAYWGSAISSTVLCAAGMFAGGMGWLMPAGYAAMEWDQAIEEGMANGKSFEESLGKSYAVAAVSLLTEKLQLASALKRFPTLKNYMLKNMAMWTAENVGQEIAQDLSIMATKQTLGLAEYTVQEYLATIPETGLAALVSSVPMAAIASHRKTKLAKDLFALGMKEENAIKFADLITEKGLDYLKENPEMMADWISSFDDVFKTTKVIAVRNALQAANTEATNNENAVKTAYSEADKVSGSGSSGYVLKTQAITSFAEPLTGYHSTPSDFKEFDESKRGSNGNGMQFGYGAYFLLDKNKDIKAYGGKALDIVGRSGEAYVLTVQLPDSETLFDFTKTLAKQPKAVKEQFVKVLNNLKQNGYIDKDADVYEEEKGQKLFENLAQIIGVKDNLKTTADAFKALSGMMREEGIKGNIYDSNADGTGVVLFNEAEDAKIVYQEKLRSGKQQIASRIRQMSEEKLNSMSLEEFLKDTGIDNWFDPEFKDRITHPDRYIEQISSMLTNTGLFSPEESQIAARHFVLLGYTQIGMVGNNDTYDFLRIFPSICNAYLYSAFDGRGEYGNILSRLPEGNLLKYAPSRFTDQVAPNMPLLRELFGEKTPSTEDLKGFATLVKMIMDGKSYQLSDNKNKEIQKAQKETMRQFEILKNALGQELNDGSGMSVLDQLKPLFAFESRLQRVTSDGIPDPNYTTKIPKSNYGLMDNEQMLNHYMDLAILRVCGLWGADADYRSSIESEGKSFWNKNRNKREILDRFTALNEPHQITLDIRAVNDLLARESQTGNKNEFKRITETDQAAQLIDDILFSKNARALLNKDGNVDILAVTTKGSANSFAHEFGHEIFLMVVDTMQQFRQYNPKKAKRIYDAICKLYEKRYGEKLTGKMTPLQTKRLHELFAGLYAHSFAVGLESTEAGPEVAQLLATVGKTNKILRNPPTPIGFITERETVSYEKEFTMEEKEIWDSVWNELNKKEDYETLLKARELIIKGLESNKHPTQLFYEVQGEIASLPNSNTKTMLMNRMKNMDNKLTALDGHILNTILVKAAVNNMFGVQLANQNLIELTEQDPTVGAAKTMAKLMTLSKAAYNHYLPDNVKNFLSKVYTTGAKKWEDIEEDVQKAVKEDGFAKSAYDFFRKLLQPLSTTAKKLNNKLHFKLAWAVYMENQYRAALKITYNRVYNARSNMDEAQKATFDDALFDQDWDTITRLFEAVGESKELTDNLKGDLESLHSDYVTWDPYGESINHVYDYFPRHIKDMDGMIDYMMQVPEYQSIAKRFAENRDLNERLATYVLSRYGDQYKPEVKQAGNTKKRMFDKVPADLRQFYASPLEALEIYYDDAMNAFGRYLIFGTNAANKIEKDFTVDTIEIMDPETKKMKEISFKVYMPTKNWDEVLKELGFFREGDSKEVKDYNKKLGEVLEGVLYRGRPHPGVTVARTINNITTINNFFTAMSNLVDFAITGYRYGFRNTLTAAEMHFRDANVVEYNKLLPDLYKEFEMDNYKLNRIFNKVFQWSGFSMLDIFGKQSSINAAFLSAKEKLESGDQSIIDKISDYMGNDQNETAIVISDILNNKISDHVKFFLFNELSAQQPLTVLDVPYYYNRHPNLRIFYQFRTFAIRQMDFFVNNVLLPKFKTNPMGALKDSALFMAMLMLFGVPKEAIKALFLGQPIDISDECISQILALGMVNKYSFYELKKGNFISAGTHMVIPSIPVLSRLSADAKGLTIGKKVGKKGRKRISIREMQSVKDVPIGGEFFYWWFGGGEDSSFGVNV